MPARTRTPGIDQPATDRPAERGDTGAGVALGPRFGAKTLDWLMLWGLLFMIVGIALTQALDGAQLTPDNLRQLQPQLSSSLALRTANVVAAVLPGIYFTVAEGLAGRTLGKQLIGLRVVGPDGGVPGLAASFRRNLWHFVLLVPAGFGPIGMLVGATSVAVSISSNPAHRGWHDRFGETTVARDG